MANAVLEMGAPKVPQRCTMKRMDLIQALTAQGPGAQIVIGGVAVILHSIQREDGSGNSFNLVVSHKQRNYNVYCCTY